MIVMHVVEQTYRIQAPLAKVWQALTDAVVAEQWGAGPAKMNATEGGEFSYWDGDIHGVFTKLVPVKLVEQDWYGHDKPTKKFVVTFTFKPDGDKATKIHLTQTNVSDDELTDMAEGWRDYYFDPIKKLLEK